MEEFIWGTVAFFAFEIFRRYRLMSTGKELFELEKNHPILASITILLMGVVAGTVAYLWHPGSEVKAFYVGLSIVSILKTLVDRPSEHVTGAAGDRVEDLRHDVPAVLPGAFVKLYFRF